MNPLQLSWPLEQQQRGELCIGGINAGGWPLVFRKQDWCNAMLYTMASACGLVMLAQLRGDQHGTVNPAVLQQFPLSSVGVDYWLAQAEETGTEPFLWAAEGACQQIYRSALNTKLPLMAPVTIVTPGVGQLRGQLGIIPVAAWVAITVVGVVATAAAAWYETEASEDRAEVDMARAEYLAKTALALDIAKLQVARGEPITVPDFINTMGNRQAFTRSNWGRAAMGVGMLAIAGGGAYAAHKYFTSERKA